MLALLLLDHEGISFDDVVLVLLQVSIYALLDHLGGRSDAIVELRVQKAVLLQVLGESQLVFNRL